MENIFGTKKIDIKSLNDEELEVSLAKLSIKGFRVEQINRFIRKGISSFSEMNNLPKNMIEKLNDEFFLTSAVIERKLVSQDGTAKYLIKLLDGEYIESVFMRYAHGDSICISTQVGCRMGCSFCASTKCGLKRNLLASEMLDQILVVAKDQNVRISNIVLMGIGEPLDNYDSVIKFLSLVHNKFGLHIGSRHISLSTCGLVDKIDDLAKLHLGITLSVSLHAPNDVIRNKIMPINSKYSVDTLLECCRRYVDSTGRRITFEYAVVENLNDSVECATQLVSKLKNMICHVNLIPVNENSDSVHKTPKREKIEHFQNVLQNGGINATIRRTLGNDIGASCGQLRAELNI